VLDRLRALSTTLEGRVAASPRLARLLPPALLAAAFAALTAFSWRQWPDVLTDFGHELYVPWRISEGARLSTDLMAGASGPLSPYLNALLFAVAGPSLTALALVNLVLLAGLTWLLLSLGRALAGPLPATLAALLVLAVFGFGQYVMCGNYNYVAPYSHGATHGLLLAFLALWLADRGASPGGAPWQVGGAGVALGLAALTKPEILVAAGAAVGLRILLSLRGERLARAARRLLTFLAPALAVPLLAVLLLSLQDPLEVALRTAFRPWVWMSTGLTRNVFYEEVTGLSRPGQNLRILLQASGAVALSGALVAALDLAAARLRVPRVLAFLAGLGAGALLWRLLPFDVLERAAQPLPLAALAGAAACLVGWLRAGDEAARRRGALGLSAAVLAGLLLAKMAFNPRIAHYGFALAMPIGLLSTLWLTGSIPAALRARAGGGALFRGAALASLSALAIAYLELSGEAFAMKRVVVGRGADRFLADERGRYVNQMLALLEAQGAPKATLAVIPEGIMINYLSRRVNPSPFLTYLPDALGAFGEEAMLQALVRDPPEFILLVFRDASEFGPQLFGLDYARRTSAWILANYERVGAPAGAFPDQRFMYGMGLLRWRHPR